MHVLSSFTAFTLAIGGVSSSPVIDASLNSRSLSPAQCEAVVVIVDVLKIQKATPFCSEFLSISASTVTSTVPSTTIMSAYCDF